MTDSRTAWINGDWKSPDDDEEIAQLMEDFKWADADSLKYIDDPVDPELIELLSKEKDNDSGI